MTCEGVSGTRRVGALPSHFHVPFLPFLQLKSQPGGRTSTLTPVGTPCRPCTSSPKSWTTRVLKLSASLAQASSLRWPLGAGGCAVPSACAPLAPARRATMVLRCGCGGAACAIVPWAVPALPPLPAGSARVAGDSRGSSLFSGPVSTARLCSCSCLRVFMLVVGRWEWGQRVPCSGAWFHIPICFSGTENSRAWSGPGSISRYLHLDSLTAASKLFINM